MLQVINI